MLFLLYIFVFFAFRVNTAREKWGVTLGRRNPVQIKMRILLSKSRVCEKADV